MHKRIVEQTIFDRKIKENIKIYIWIDLFAYMCMHICPAPPPSAPQIPPGTKPSTSHSHPTPPPAAPDLHHSCYILRWWPVPPTCQTWALKMTNVGYLLSQFLTTVSVPIWPLSMSHLPEIQIHKSMQSLHQMVPGDWQQWEKSWSVSMTTEPGYW